MSSVRKRLGASHAIQLDAAEELARPELLDAVRDDQRSRWTAGERIGVEDYLRRFPNLADDDDASVELIYAEFVLAEEMGLSPSADDFVRRFPQWADELERQFEVHRALRAAAAPDGPQPTLGPAVGSTRPRNSGQGPRRLSQHDGQNIGGFEIEGELGRGGMGIVYRARQRALDRVVALKVSHAGDDESGTRFRREAEAASQLQHPNIVQIFEVGEDAQRPFFAMELVEGGSLAQRLDGTPLPALEAARLTEILARAMYAAHERGVIHRDLKPSNVLLTRDGVPKIADFGLAKRLEVESGQTRSGAILGTPSYMAPEQARGEIRNVGPLCDQYSLGAMLYEMLTGRPPFRGATPLETLLQVVSSEPVPPSRLVPKIPRDVETICLKALDKTPQRRYGIAAELADDLGRFLQGEPIRARPVGRLEQAIKWSRRRPLAAASLAMIALLGVAMSVQSLRLAKERDRADLRAAEAAKSKENALRQAESYRLENEKVQTINRFWNDLLASADPAIAKGRALTVRDVLDEAAQRVDTQWNDQPVLRAALEDTIGRTYWALGVNDVAERHLRSAVALRRKWLAADDPELADSLLRLARQLVEATKPTQALANEGMALCREATEIFHRRLGDQDLRTVEARGYLGKMELDAGRRTESEKTIADVSKGLNMSSMLPTDMDGHLDTVRSLWNSGQREAALAHIHETIAPMREKLGPKNPFLGSALRWVAYRQMNRNDYITAVPILQCAVEAYRDALGNDCPEVVAALTRLAYAHHGCKQYEDQETVAREALELGTRLLPPEHPETRSAALKLGESLCYQGRSQEAIGYLKSSLDRAVTKGDPQQFYAQMLLGVSLGLTGDLDGAERQFREVIAAPASKDRREDAERQLLWLLVTCRGADVSDRQEAVSLAKSIVDRDPKSSSAWLRHAMAMYRAGEPTAALEALDQSRSRSNHEDWIAAGEFCRALCEKALALPQARESYERGVRRVTTYTDPDLQNRHEDQLWHREAAAVFEADSK